MRYLKDYKTNRQVRMLHNVKAAQSRQGWKLPEVLRAIADAKEGIAYETCAECGKWTYLDCSHQIQ
jgi:hypothetical protein